MQRLFQRQALAQTEAAELLRELIRHDQPAQKLIFLTAYSMRAAEWEEWTAFVSVLNENARPVEFSGYDAVWDWITIREGHRHSPAISLAISLVVSAVGLPVVKWGDSGYGGSVGYSDVLEYMGVPLDYQPERAAELLQQQQFCYLHAPSVYPDLHKFAEARRELRIATWLDTALPLLHPAAQAQPMIATSSVELVRFYQYWYQQQGRRFSLVHDFSGSAEISLSDSFKFLTTETEATLRLADTGLPALDTRCELQGSSSAVWEARRLWKILTESASDAEMMTVLANAAWWIRHIRQESDVTGALAEAEAALASGRALQRLEALVG